MSARTAWITCLIVTAAVSACQSDAQSSTAQADPLLATANAGQHADGEYRLTMPVVRKTLSLPLVDVSDELPIDRVRWMSVKELAGEFERIPATRTAIAGSGLSTGEVAAALQAIMRAEEYLLREELAGTGGMAAPAPLEEGVLKHNVDLLRANREEIERLIDRDE